MAVAEIICIDISLVARCTTFRNAVLIQIRHATSRRSKITEHSSSTSVIQSDVTHSVQRRIHYCPVPQVAIAPSPAVSVLELNNSRARSCDSVHSDRQLTVEINSSPRFVLVFSNKGTTASLPRGPGRKLALIPEDRYTEPAAFSAARHRAPTTSRSCTGVRHAVPRYDVAQIEDTFHTGRRRTVSN